MSISGTNFGGTAARSRSKATLAAAVLMGLTVCIHLFMGGPEVHDPMLSSPLPVGLKAFASILWHAVTVVLVTFTIALYSLSRRSNAALEATLGAVQLGFAGLFLAYGAVRLGTVWLMPQWVIFAGLPLLTRFGQWRATR